MVTPTRKPTRLAALRLKYRGRFDAVMMAVYLLVVYVWAFGAYPLGRDFSILADPRAELPGFSGGFIAALLPLFGSSPFLYHGVNALILYACMLCMYRMVNCAVGGPWWLGTLAASLFMANPVHTESMLNLTGSADLLPALAALLFMAVYTVGAATPTPAGLGLSLILFAVAVAPFEQNCALVLVVLLYEWLVVPSSQRRRSRTLLFALIGILGLAWHAGSLVQHLPDAPPRLASLFFLFYPIGFLPRTIDFFSSHPWLEWLSAAVVLFLLVLVNRGARRPAILFGLLAMAAVRIAPDARPIDPVHLTGGGQLLLANALYALALVALFHRIMEHPKWRFPMVTLTTVFAASFFVLQVSANLDWRRAGTSVAAFQEESGRFAAAHPGTPVPVAPDWQHVGWAPVHLSDSIRYETPFSEPLPHISLLRVSAPEQGAYQVAADELTSERLALTFTTEHREGFSYLRPKESTDGLALSLGEEQVTRKGGKSVRTLRVEVRANGHELPQAIIPGKG